MEMGHVIQNEFLEIHFDLPQENYQLSRFDWTGKIVDVRYKGTSLAGHELPEGINPNYGQGFYNEFGITMPVGFEEAQPGDWFHKIGVGLLKKDNADYDFLKCYETKPARFEVQADADQVTLFCRSDSWNGYSYILEKVIKLISNSFVISYHLQNTGEKTILTNEYCHNFISINKRPMGADYTLHFPFDIRPERFDENVNKENLVNINTQSFSFNGTPREPFFFSNISGNNEVSSKWTLENTSSQIGISETGSFKTSSINLWGWGHVISPELFVKIDLASGQSTSWQRTFHAFDL